MTDIETRKVASGWNAVLERDDGIVVKYWGPTEEIAKHRLLESEDLDG